MTPLDPATELLRAVSVALSTARVLETQLEAVDELHELRGNDLFDLAEAMNRNRMTKSRLFNLEQRAQAACPPVPVPVPEKEKMCPDCKAEARSYWTCCPDCGAQLVPVPEALTERGVLDTLHAATETAKAGMEDRHWTETLLTMANEKLHARIQEEKR